MVNEGHVASSLKDCFKGMDVLSPPVLSGVLVALLIRKLMVGSHKYEIIKKSCVCISTGVSPSTLNAGPPQYRLDSSSGM